MKTVQSGAHYTTVTVDTAEAVKFSFPSTSLSVEASGGDITVALTETAQAGDDETITVPDGESRMFIHHRMNVDTYYLTGSGTATLYASNMGDVNPFKGKAKGGDGGDDTTHYKGTTTTPLENGSTTNPIVIDGESYTAVFGDVVVYGYTEFVFDGTQWSEFGRPFDTTPTAGSTNAVTSDGIYQKTPWVRDSGDYSARIGYNSSASGKYALAYGYYAKANADHSMALGRSISANREGLTAMGSFNEPKAGDIFELGKGTSAGTRENILEVTRTSMNVNGDIKVNNVTIPTPYTTMPTITADMLGKIAMYVGATGNGYTQGCFYIASTDGAAAPTYSWVQIGSGRTETVLWENTGTTNPDTITLSEAYTNFDEIVIYDGGNDKGVSSNVYVRSVLSQNAIIGIIEYTDRRIWYRSTSPTTLSKVDEDTAQNIALHSIVGIKY